MANERRVSVGAAKSMLGCSDDFVRSLIAADHLEAVDIRKPGAARALWSVSVESIRRYISSRRANCEETTAGAVVAE